MGLGETKEREGEEGDEKEQGPGNKRNRMSREEVEPSVIESKVKEER